MKQRFLPFIICLFASIFLFGQDGTEIVKFDQLSKHLGYIKKGSQIADIFEFENISDSEVTIDIVSTCECTEAKWTTSPIAPGKKGRIEFVFDSNKKEKEEPVDIDVYFLNINPKTENPYSVYLQYTYSYTDKN